MKHEGGLETILNMDALVDFSVISTSIIAYYGHSYVKYLMAPYQTKILYFQ